MKKTITREDVALALEKAWKKIEEIEHFTQGSFAVNEEGGSTGYKNKDAVRWCMIGSLWATGNEELYCEDEDYIDLRLTALQKTALDLFGTIWLVNEVNDQGSLEDAHQRVEQLMTTTVKRIREEENFFDK